MSVVSYTTVEFSYRVQPYGTKSRLAGLGALTVKFKSMAIPQTGYGHDRCDV
jgi:hypothetical protein